MPPKNPRLGGLVLGSTDPDRLWDWYRAAFAPDASKDDGMPVLALELGGTYLIFERRDDVGAKTAEPGRVLINIDVDDIRGAEAHLNGLNLRWIRPVTEVDEGMFISTVEDADGNYVQVCQGPEQPPGG